MSSGKWGQVERVRGAQGHVSVLYEDLRVNKAIMCGVTGTKFEQREQRLVTTM